MEFLFGLLVTFITFIIVEIVIGGTDIEFPPKKKEEE